MNREQLEKNNELFANALALKIIWAAKMTKLLRSQMSNTKAAEVMEIYKAFLADYEEKLNKI